MPHMVFMNTFHKFCQFPVYEDYINNMPAHDWMRTHKNATEIFFKLKQKEQPTHATKIIKFTKLIYFFLLCLYNNLHK